jgi:mannan endo-1,6-alpha-mannosidase
MNWLQTNGTEPWESRLLALSKRSIEFFFPDGIAVERACELEDRVQCTTDMLSFKGYVARFLAQTVQVAPNLRDVIMPALRSSATGMAKSCNPDGTCGFRWNRGAYDGMTGAGQQMNALGALMSLMVVEPGILPPVTNLTGGTSIGNPAGGGEDAPERILKPITTADRAGAGILTTIGLIGIIGTLATMSTTFGEGGKWFKR